MNTMDSLLGYPNKDNYFPTSVKPNTKTLKKYTVCGINNHDD